MAVDAELDRLAELLGVKPHYFDIWGKRRDIPPSTKRDLVGAMGFAAGSDDEIRDSLRRVEETPWRRVVSPVAILDQGGYAAIEVMLPEDARGVGWSIELEDGGARTGGSPIEEMEWLEERRIDGRLIKRWRVALPGDLPLGYHRLAITTPVQGTMSLISAPQRCLLPDDLAPGRRLWGFGIQLYGLRSRDDWGIGDFGGLGRFAEITAGLGGDAVGVNPLHALFPADPGHTSPYSPSSRSFLDVLYIDLSDVTEGGSAGDLARNPDFRQRIEVVRAADMVDYAQVAALKMTVLEAAYADFKASGRDREAFEAFRRDQGRDLELQALFEALHEHFFHGEGKWDWHGWPEAYHRPDTPEVAAFAQRAADRTTFFAWLQFLADRQFARAAERARGAGMVLGFYRDLAVASHPGGAESWANPGVVLDGANVGAPPDQFSPLGQNWGLAPLSPAGLLERAYEPFIAALRANMRHAGALRIDHAMALRHLFWIPVREGHEGGAYVRYPERDLMRLIALESHRNRCVVIGEALGTVPEGFPDALRHAGILSYRVLYFERSEDGGFLPPSGYPEDALVSVTTHDLPTLQGWWSGHDQDWRRRLGMYPDDEAFERDRAERMSERELLFDALRAAGLVADEEVPERLDADHAVAIHRYLAETAGRILIVQIEDALGEVEQPNLPGTTTEHPNWQRKLPLALDRLEEHPLLRAMAGAVREARSAGTATSRREPH